MRVEETASTEGVLEALEAADVRKLLLIRHFERKLLDLYSTGAVGGTTHTCIGQEYIPIAIDRFLTPDDYIFSNHRGHGHYLARFDDCAGLLAEILGRSGAVCNGVGGSQHIRRDRFMSTGVQGEGILLATGVAVHLKRAAQGAVALAYVGDGTWGEGGVYEALNAASLWALPLVVVVENNGIAQSTPVEMAMAGTIAGRCRAFGVRHISIDGFRIESIRSAVAGPWNDVRNGCGPLVIEFETVRLGPHSKGDDTRSEQQLDLLHKKDWYGELLDRGGGRLLEVEDGIRDDLDRLFGEIVGRPLAERRQ